MADLTTQKHNDRWLADLLQGASAPAFPRAVAALGQASQANRTGDYATSFAQADAALRLFRASGNKAGALRAQFEQIYAEQLMRRTDECRRSATSALEGMDGVSYQWLEIQLRLEEAVCTFLGKDDWGSDERLSRVAMDRALASGYDGLYLRSLFFVADGRVRAGDLTGGLKSVALAQQRYWSGQVPPFRAYGLYDLLATVPELFSMKRPHLVMAICSEATALAESGDNLLARAREHSSAARAAVAANQPQEAERQYAEAARLFALAPKTEASRGYVLENEIHTAQLEASLGHFDDGIERLTQIQGDIRPLTNKYLAELFYATLGELQLKSHHAAQAEQAFRPALESTERRLSSLNSEASRARWSKEAAPVYLGMAEAELVQGRNEESLDYFEWYMGSAQRAGENRPGKGGAEAPEPGWLASRLSLLTDRTVIAYAALPDGLAIWTYDNNGVSAKWIAGSTHDLEELAARFYDLASDPTSEKTALQRDSRSLYQALIAPVEQRLVPGRTLMIEADGWLGRVPFEALLDGSGRYLIERGPVVHSLGQYNEAALHEDMPISSEMRALIVGSTASSQTEGLIPLPDVVAEADSVANNFSSAAVLKGSEATLSAVESELPNAAVFHFTGHSLAKPNGAALMLEAGTPEKGATVLLDADEVRRLRLRKMQLAVLSTCNTAAGEGGARGFNSMAEALERAGVPHVVASRWAVDSVQTRLFIKSFYQNALSSQSISEAVRQGARSMIANPQTAHPYYWSAFSAYGRP